MSHQGQGRRPPVIAGLALAALLAGCATPASRHPLAASDLGGASRASALEASLARPGVVTFERVRYSVPASYANRPVSLRVYAERIVVAAEGQLLCEHRRVIDRRHDSVGHTVYDWRHYLAVLQRKPGALRNGAPFVELPAAFRQLQAALLKQPGGDREMVEVLALVLHHDEQAVLAAVELALEAGVPTKMHVLNVLHRLLDSKAPPPPVTAPQALRLVREPLANVNRYDDLRTSERKVRHAS